MNKIDLFDSAAYVAGAELLEETLGLLESETSDVSAVDIAVWSPDINEAEPVAIIARIYDYRGDTMDSSIIDREEMQGLPVFRFMQSEFEPVSDSRLSRELGFRVAVFSQVSVESLKEKIVEVLGKEE